MSQLAAYLSGLDWSPLLISLKTGIVATIISFFLGIYAARKVVKAGPRVKAVADGILTLPMVLPPTVAGTVIAFPLMYRNARAAFEQIDVNLIYAARTLGMPEIKIFWKVVVPAAGPGIASGTVLTFARALGEYGATSMLAGNIPKKTSTISQKIAMVIQDGDYATAGFWVIVILVIAFVVIFLLNIITAKNMKHVSRW